MNRKLRIFSKYINIFLFYFLLNSDQSAQEFKTINITNETISLNITSLPSYYKIMFESDSYIPNYMKIEVKQNNITEKSDNSNLLLSYYQQDSDFKNRKQFSQNSYGNAFIWLNKDQIKNEFYFSIESPMQKSNNYTLSILLKETAELSLDEQYTYYVSEENKQMNFSIVNDLNSEDITQNLISIWAKGNKNINSLINIPDNSQMQKHQKYNAYIIFSEEFNKISYNFNITGEVGDMINVGSILFAPQDFIISNKLYGDQEIELTGFLKKNFIDTVCYKFKKINSFFEHASYVIYDNVENLEESQQYNYNLEGYDLKCVGFPENTMAEEIFYSIYFTPLENNNTEIKRINKFSPIQLPGFNYKKYLQNGETIGLVPIMPDDDFSFLTYYVNLFKGKLKVEMYTCENYPLCNIDELQNKKDGIPLRYFNAYSLTFAKNELDEYLLSNINPNKKVLLISCENKNEITTDEGKENDTCLIETNIYTDKNKVLMAMKYNYHKYSKKNNEDKFLIPKNEYENIELNIEILSGNIEIKMNSGYSLLEKDNKKIYKIQNNENEIEISILAKNDSVYNIRYYIPEFGPFSPNSVMSGSNYLFFLPNNSDFKEGLLLSNYFEYLDNPPDKYFVGIYPLNCEMKMDYVPLNFIPLPIDLKWGFHQEILDQKIKNNIIGYKINKNENISDECFFYLSVFKYDNQSINDNNGIFLENNVSQKFIFNENYTFLKFSYAYVEKEKDVNIALNLMKNEKYKLKLVIKDLDLKNEYYISKNETVIIESKDIKKICQNEQQICIISFNLISENNDESLVELRVSAEINNSTDNDNNKNNDNNNNNGGINVVVLILIIVAVIILIALIIIIITKLKTKKGDNLNSQIENFKGDNQENILSEQTS